MLFSTDDTPLMLAQKAFGPLLLCKWWISDPDGRWGDKFEVLREWGHWETGARLILISGVLWLTICVGVLVPKLRRRQPVGSKGDFVGDPGP
jgi:hypothetical protein